MPRSDRTLRRSYRVLALAGLLAGLVLAGPEARAQAEGDIHVYLTVEEALLEVFPASTQYITETVTLSEDEQRRTAQALGRQDLGATHDVVLCYDAKGRFLGYAVITDEMGKHRPITFIVGVTPEFAVQQVAIMVYRESRGGEVRMPRFLYQYKGKRERDPIRINRDIINVSGATISVRSVNAGVRKVLHLLGERYRDDPPAATFAAERATIMRSGE